MTTHVLTTISGNDVEVVETVDEAERSRCGSPWEPSGKWIANRTVDDIAARHLDNRDASSTRRVRSTESNGRRVSTLLEDFDLTRVIGMS